jgi:mannitol/fructose-specific phosphotransferase system IIA component (Ntr-type)
MDSKPVHLFFLIAAPEDTIGAHLNVMARLSFLMKSPENRERLLNAKNPGEVMEVLDSVD